MVKTDGPASSGSMALRESQVVGKFEPNIRVDRDYRSLVYEIHQMDKRLSVALISKEYQVGRINRVLASEVYNLSLPCPFSENEIRAMFTSEKENLRSGASQGMFDRRAVLICADDYSDPWTPETVKTIHRIMSAGLSTKDPGMYRDAPAETIELFGFVTATSSQPERIDQEMNELLSWLNSSPYDAVTTATIFIQRFVDIMPFFGTNDEVAEMMFLLILKAYGLDDIRYCAVLSEVVVDQDEYGMAWLKAKNDGEYLPLLMLAAKRVHKAYEKALMDVEKNDVSGKLDTISMRLLELSERVPLFTVADAASATGTGEQTARDRLSALVSLGLLDRTGQTKGMRFSPTDVSGTMIGTARKRLMSDKHLTDV